MIIKMIQSKKLLFLLLVASILFLFVYNAINYDPIQGYDAESHHEYINNFFLVCLCLVNLI